jgi:hypothetical protein
VHINVKLPFAKPSIFQASHRAGEGVPRQRGEVDLVGLGLAVAVELPVLEPVAHGARGVHHVTAGV